MAVMVDERARREITRRQRSGRDATLLLRVARWGGQEYVVVDWAQRRGEVEGLAPLVDGVAVRMDARMIAYARGHTLTISAWRWGPFAQMVVANEPVVLLDLQEWEQRVRFAASARHMRSA